MDRSDASALADLQMHWDEAYVIGLDGDIWSARYRTATNELRAHTCTELRELIRSDYAYRQKVDLATNYCDDDGDPADGDPADGDPADGDPADGDPADGDPADGDPAESGEADSDSSEHPERVNFAAIQGERMST
jgi:hypothetical protein